MHRILLILLLLGSACSTSDTGTAGTTPTISTAPDERAPIIVPLSLHVMVEAGDPASELSSARTVDDVRAFTAGMQAIWAQADVVFEPILVHQLEVPRQVLQGILLGDTGQFFDQVNVTFVPENAQAINGFYVRSAFGVNGFTPQGSNLFFVVDDPTVPDARVSSHEIGHIFGLHHDLTDADQLMFSGTDGTGLSELEQTIARYSVQGLFPQGIDP